MIFIKILLAVSAVIALILFIPINLTVEYHDGFFIYAGGGFIKFRILPKKEKKLRLRKFSKKNYEKMIAALDDVESDKKRGK